MKSSLNTSLDELAAIDTHLDLVDDPKKYQHVDATYARNRFRDSKDLPVDGARHSFRSQKKRLENYDKTKSDNNEKTIVHTRLQNRDILPPLIEVGEFLSIF